MDILILVLAASATMLATGLGAVPVFFLGTRAELLRPILLGVAIGTMTVASIVGLLRPALQEGGPLSVLGGLAAGVAFLVGSGSLLGRRDVHVGELRGAGVRSRYSSSASSSFTACLRGSRSGRRTHPTGPD